MQGETYADIPAPYATPALRCDLRQDHSHNFPTTVPTPEYTADILDILAKERVPATFFVIGENAAKNPELLLHAASTRTGTKSAITVSSTRTSSRDHARADGGGVAPDQRIVEARDGPL